MPDDRSSSSVGGPALKAVFCALGFLGFLATWGRTIADGSLALMQESLKGEFILPSTEHALRDSFSGIAPLDYLARTLVVFFWEAIDGSHPRTSAAGIYMAGQMAPVIVAQYLDGLRRGQGASAVGPSLWWFLFAAAAIGFTGAIWGLVSLATWPTVSPAVGLEALQELSLVASPASAALILPATYLSFIGSMVVMALPSPRMVSNNFRQWAIVVWNLFPLALTAIVHGGGFLLDAARPAAASRDSHRDAHLRVVQWLGAGAMTLGFAMHVGVSAVSISAALFSPMFAPGYADELHPLNLAVPPLAIEKAETPGDGIWSFVVWDQVFGFSFMMLVFLAQLRNAMRASGQLHESLGWAKMSAICLLSSFFVGPGTTVMGVSWARDYVLYGQDKKAARPAKKIQGSVKG